MANCSNDFPTTDVLFDEVGADPAVIVLLSVGCLFSLITVILHVEIVLYMRRVGYARHRHHFVQRWLLNGLYPVINVASLITLVVPTSTVLNDLIIACYSSWCIFVFVQMTLDYYGGESNMIDALSEDKVNLATPPCCCCCCCILQPITLTKKSVRVLKAFAMQVAIVRPILLFVSAVLWTDGKYEQKMDFRSSYTYISILTGISTFLSVYGMIVLFRASAKHLRENRYIVKFAAMQIMVVVVNLQNTIFNIMADNDVPGCIGSRGPRVRASSINHSILVIESFLLCLLARFGYRLIEPNLERLEKRGRFKSHVVGGHGDGNDVINDVSAEEDRKIDSNNVPSYGAHSNEAMTNVNHF